ncbi:MAG: ABC transporter ATP-binding protein [Telmatospirillum sp.]|nr:ABC transporter ATP-binding protein [Telmatospirillum sp.]
MGGQPERRTQTPLAIRVEGCARTFPDGVRALDRVDLDIRAGETLALLGPSGCGKTTLLRLIAGLDHPDPGGRILFDGEDVTALPIERRRVGMVFQSYALFPNMSVAANVAYGLKIQGMAPDMRRARVTEMLEMMRIAPLADRAIDQLSGGQRQRVALARAIAPRPRLLLLDEPLTALDAKLRDALRVEIDQLLRALGTTALYVTHDQAEAMALGDRVVVMTHGRIAQIGTPYEIYHRPAGRFVADFVGLMNRIRGTLSGDGVRCPGGIVPLAAAGPSHRPAGARRPGDGAPVEIQFRPEDAVVAAPGQGHVRGTVTASFFLGDRVRILVEGVGTTPLTVETGGRIDPLTDATLAAGAPIELRIQSAPLAPEGEA